MKPRNFVSLIPWACVWPKVNMTVCRFTKGRFRECCTVWIWRKSDEDLQQIELAERTEMREAD